MKLSLYHHTWNIKMDVETARNLCLEKPGSTESLPFDEETLVFKVKGKMFALLSLSGDLMLNLKCDPEKALELREQHEDITPGYHMNKTHWNTLFLGGNIPESIIRELIAHSYNLVSENVKSRKK